MNLQLSDTLHYPLALPVFLLSMFLSFVCLSNLYSVLWSEDKVNGSTPLSRLLSILPLQLPPTFSSSTVPHSCFILCLSSSWPLLVCNEVQLLEPSFQSNSEVVWRPCRDQTGLHLSKHVLTSSSPPHPLPPFFPTLHPSLSFSILHTLVHFRCSVAVPHRVCIYI